MDERYRYDCDFGDLSETDRGDGYCDLQLNTAYCDYDGGERVWLDVRTGWGSPGTARNIETEAVHTESERRLEMYWTISQDSLFDKKQGGGGGGTRDHCSP